MSSDRPFQPPFPPCFLPLSPTYHASRWSPVLRPSVMSTHQSRFRTCLIRTCQWSGSGRRRIFKGWPSRSSPIAIVSPHFAAAQAPIYMLASGLLPRPSSSPHRHPPGFLRYIASILISADHDHSSLSTIPIYLLPIHLPPSRCQTRPQQKSAAIAYVQDPSPPLAFDRLVRSYRAQGGQGVERGPEEGRRGQEGQSTCGCHRHMGPHRSRLGE